MLKVPKIRKRFWNQEDYLHRLASESKGDQTLKLFSKKEYWGTHVLENIYANKWCTKTFKKNVADILETLKSPVNDLEFHAACWALIKLSSWFERIFDLDEHYKIAIDKLQKIIDNENKYFEDTEDNKSFIAGVEQQLYLIKKLQKESQEII